MSGWWVRFFYMKAPRVGQGWHPTRVGPWSDTPVKPGGIWEFDQGHYNHKVYDQYHFYHEASLELIMDMDESHDWLILGGDFMIFHQVWMAQKLEFLHVFKHFPDNGCGVNLCVSIGKLLRFLCYCLHQWESHAIPHLMEDDQSVQKCIIVKHYTSISNEWHNFQNWYVFFLFLSVHSITFPLACSSSLGVNSISACYGEMDVVF